MATEGTRAAGETARPLARWTAAFLDRRFRAHKVRYILQSALATASVLAILLALDAIAQAVIIASLGASSFIAFTVPKANVSRSRFLVGGYAVGLAAGSLAHWLSQWPALADVSFIAAHSYAIFGALAVGMAIFAMVVTNTEHPPAAGLALGLVLNEWNYRAIAVVVVGIVALAVVKRLLRPVLINLT